MRVDEIAIKRQIPIRKSINDTICFGATDWHIKDSQIEKCDRLRLSFYKIKGLQGVAFGLGRCAEQ